MRKKWTMEQSLRGQNQRAKQAVTRHDLTTEQWLGNNGWRRLNILIINARIAAENIK